MLQIVVRYIHADKKVIVLTHNYNKSNSHITFCLNCVTVVQKYLITRECTSNLLVAYMIHSSKAQIIQAT